MDSGVLGLDSPPTPTLVLGPNYSMDVGHVNSKGSPTRVLDCKQSSQSTTFETSNRYVQSFLCYEIFAAIEIGSLTRVRNVLLSYPDLDFNFHIKDVTPLSLSLYRRRFEIFQLFLRHQDKMGNLNLDMISKDSLGRMEPPIITACRLHFLEGVVTLVTKGADIDMTDNQGHTALWVASRQQMPDLVDYLISNGASVSKMDKFGCTPLLTALMYRVSSMIIRTLIIHGSPLTAPVQWSSAEQSPLFWATKNGNLEIVKLMLQAGVGIWETRAVRIALSNSDVDSEILDLLDAETQCPPSLQHQCKTVLRTTIRHVGQGKNFIKSMQCLPLPSSIIQYLLLFR
ncbi:ankyrin repeat and SOCS box protein 8 [Aplysia californica]|uniref:Ankyrin repeat and SOCS box protein 8 n=1 Tax=Aplysia californica TaxID=6500 RepID=A0ABM0JG71_APLCA|nr:ankyrin repeat and SOCS box protein 8 [Aplysia californica]